MKNIFLALSLSFLFLSCSNNLSKENQNKTPLNNNSNASIQINKSVVHAEVDELYLNDRNNFVIKAKILNVEEDPSYASMAVEGEEYLLTPGFVLNEEHIVDQNSERNISLNKLSLLKRGDKFKAVIFYENLKGWFIQEIIGQ